METKIFQSDEIEQAAKLLRQGELVAFPTETVYGLGANALLPESVKQVFAVKGRPSDNPLIVHVADFSMTKDYVESYHPLTEKIIKNFWPGPLTLIFSIKSGSLSPVVTGGLSTAAFRMPDNKKTLSLIEETGAPLVGPSANTSGKPSPTTALHVYHDLKNKIAGILDDGATQIGVESTVLDLSSEVPTILRPGAVTKETLEAVLGIEVPLDKHLVKESETPKAPGMKYKHYSPDTPVLMIKPADWKAALTWADTNNKKVGLLASPKIAKSYSSADRFVFADDSIEAATHGLFSGLRALDEAKTVDIIFAEVFPEDHLGLAYMNRLKKAAAQNYFSKSQTNEG
ncbi:L-threonylcarbamoyladenylate synthase [Enterococcus pseudoavium]|uniref:Threonylcarbamoyl-AMP synthase n=1 Tax=Enterococcus pseudoavium TaxID=44007 RepID=A0ABU3FHJ3_9ENTE|nr:L-threonylcarbamoyladenylate synthase [Enterococcus pseudoavium]MDT2753303.1 L-threonylcarbamoyladenylate synthase [Enterococcus pseudoavium]MDT2770540.1 L-threonylcarbamoyladenylate synthase [Enterococcus pseudoavium]